MMRALPGAAWAVALTCAVIVGTPSAARGQPVDTIISTAGGLLGHPQDLALSPDGTLFVADRLNGQVRAEDSERSPE